MHLAVLGFRHTTAGALVPSGPLDDQRIQAQIDRIAEAGSPRDADLEDAPTLARWAPAITPYGVTLIGAVSNHPLLGTRRLITTSPLLAMDSDGRWARTMSRWYRLGRPWR